MYQLSLRGGGGICSAPRQQKINQIAPMIKGNDAEMIEVFIKNVSHRCNNILKASQKIGLQESKDAITQEIKWFQLCSQYLNQIICDKQMVQENILLVLRILEILLEATLNIIQTQSLLSYHLLKICNLFSLLIFIYYVNSPNPPMKQEKQNNYYNLLAEIKKFIEFGGQNFYQNSIIYEFEVIKMCINTFPNDSTKGNEIIIDTFRGIISSITTLSPSKDLINALLDGAMFIYHKIQQSNQIQIFQVIFYLEQLKWSIIEKIQDGVSINSVRQSLMDNYNKLIKKSNQWIIKCSWIKLISELLQYTPTISKSKYEQMMNNYRLSSEWNKIIELKIIIPIDENIGLISNTENGDQAGRIFKTWFIILDQLKNICLNGYQEIPKFDTFVNEESDLTQEDNMQALVKILEYIDSLQIIQVSNMYQSLLQNFQEYIETWNFIFKQDIIEVTLQQSKIELQLVLSQKLNSQLQILIVNGRIINKQLESFIEQEQNNQEVQILNEHLYYLLINNYFKIIQMISGKDSDIFKDYQQFIHLFPEIQFKNTISNLNQQRKFDKLINQNKDIIHVIALLDEKSFNFNQTKFKPSFKIKQYQIILSQYGEIVLTQIRQEIQAQQSTLHFMEQTILNTKMIYDQKFNFNIKQYQVYFSIISHMISMYNEINNEVKDLKFNEQQIQEFRFLPINSILQIVNSAIDQEFEFLTSQIILKQVQNQEYFQYPQKLKQIQIQLLTLKNLYERKQEQLANLNNQVMFYKAKYLKLIEVVCSQDQQYEEMLNQNGKNLTTIIKQGNSRLNLINILDQRKKLLSNIQNEYKYNTKLINQIQEEILFTQIINQEQFYDLFEQNKEQFLININQSNEIMIAQIQEGLNNDNKQKIVDNNLIKIINVLDQITQQINQDLLMNDEWKIQLRNQNQLIFNISNLLFSKQNITEQKYDEIDKEYRDLINSFLKITGQKNQKIKELILESMSLIDQLPQMFVMNHQFMMLDQEKQQKNGLIQQIEQSKSIKQKIQDSFKGDSWRYKEYFYFCCLYTYSFISNKEIKQQLGSIILLGKFKETDLRIKNTLKNKIYSESIEQLVNNEWASTHENIKVSLQRTLNQLQAIQLQLQGEERLIQRENLVQKHKDLESQLEQQIKNVKELGDILGITIYFMKDIKKELLLIQSKLDNIMDSINQIGQDIKFLRGKTPQQLLEIRMEQVLQNKYFQDSQSVYVQIQVRQFNFEIMKEDDNTHLFSYDQFQDGEIDKFLRENNKTTFLIHGPAGSGKSIAARKIEEYLWLQYKKQINGQIWSQNVYLRIPIFIQLPTLKEPQFSAIDESLQSQIYKFDQKQVNQFMDQIQNSKIELVFIMDSYDELSTQYQGINIIQSNKLYQWKQKNEQRNPKVITTSRSEIFINTNYRSWFWESDVIGFKSFKEIKLQPFNLNQREEFLYQFSQLQLKMQIKELLEIISKNQQQDVLIYDALQIYDQLQTNSQQTEFLLNTRQIKQLIKIIKSHPNVISINSDQEVSFSKQLQLIWSADQYQQSINQMEIEDILDTPFMLNIVVQVLPQMSEIISTQNYIKDSFKQAYVKEKRNQIQSIFNRYQSNNKFITDKYTKEDHLELQKIIDDKKNDMIINESLQIWNCLIDQNFFQNFNIILQQKEVIKQLENLNELSSLFHNIIKQNERDVDNYIIIYKALLSKKSTIYEFYHFFLNNYIEKQRIKFIYNNDIKNQNQFLIDVEQYADKLAVAMTLSNITTVEIKPKGILFKIKEENNPFDNFFDDQDQYANYRKVIRKCLPLKQKENFHSFNHKTIQEYLFAKDIVEFINSMEQNIDQMMELTNQNTEQMVQSVYVSQIKDKFERSTLKLKTNQSIERFEKTTQLEKSSQNFNINQFREKLENSSLNQVNLGESKMVGAFKFIQIAIKSNMRSQETCYKLSLISSIFESLIRLSSNALYILINVLTIIKGKDFSRINIADISLKGAYFKKCNFTDSKFLRINLNGIHLNKVDLSRTDWVDIYTNDLPIIEAKQIINYVCFSNDSKEIIGCDIKGMIHIWDKQSCLLINSFKCYDGNVLYVKQLENNKIISLGFDSEDQSLKIWDQEFTQIGQLLIYSENLQLFTHNNLYVGQIDYDNNLSIHSINDQQLIQQWNLEDECQQIQIIMNQDQIFTVFAYSFIIILWDFNKNLIQKFDFPEIQSYSNLQFKFSADCQLLFISAKYDRKIWIFNFQSKESLYHELKHDISNLILTSNNKYLACNDKTGLIIYQTETFIPISPPQSGHQQQIICIQFDAEQNEIVTTSYDCTVKLWDFNSFIENQSISQNQFDGDDQIIKLQYSPDGMSVYYCKKSQTSLFVVRVESGEQIEQIHFQFVDFKICQTDQKQNFVKYDINLKQSYVILQLSTTKFGNIHSIKIIQSNNCRLFQLVDKGQCNQLIVLLNYEFQLMHYTILWTKFMQFSHNTKFIYYFSLEKEEKRISTMFIDHQNISDNFISKLQEPQFITDTYVKKFVVKSDDQYILSYNQQKLFVWNTHSNQLVLQLSINIHKLYISLTIQQFLIIQFEDKIAFYETENYSQVGQLSISIKSLVPCPSKYQFITLGTDRLVRVWKINKQLQNQKSFVFNQGFVIPKIMKSNIIDNVIWNKTKITSHLKFDLQKIWEQRDK